MKHIYSSLTTTVVVLVAAGFIGNSTVNAKGRGGGDNDRGSSSRDSDRSRATDVIRSAMERSRDRDRDSSRRDSDRKSNDHKSSSSHGSTKREKTKSDYVNEGKKDGFKDGLNFSDKEYREKNLKGKDHKRWYEQGYQKGNDHGTDIAIARERRAFYDSRFRYYHQGYYYDSPYWYDSTDYDHTHYSGGGSTTTVVGGVTCSSESLAKNTIGTEAVLQGLYENELAEQPVFKQKVADLMQLRGQERVEEAFRLVGVKNPKDAKEVMGVVYARQASKETVARVADNLNLTDSQAKLVIETMTAALKSR